MHSINKRFCGLRRTAAAGLLGLVLTTSAQAQKPPQLIRAHLLEQVDISVEPLHIEAADALLTETLWWVGMKTPVSPGESFQIMAVRGAQVLRIYRHGLPRPRENFLRFLPADFRVQSEADARRLVAAAAALNMDPFGKPETPEVPVEAMRIDTRDGEYFFVDGERFDKATGYRMAVDEQGRVTALEYSWELPVPPLEDED